MASDDEDIPETGAIFTFGKTKFAENLANKFWIRDDKILQVACGDEHSAVITSKGRLFTFGSNNWGQLGHGNNKPYTRPTTVKKFKGDIVKSVACGRSHTLVVSEAGVFSFGDGADGQLGHGECENYNLPTQIQDFNDKLVTQISCGAEHSAAVTDNGELYVWGSGSEGQLGIGVDECERPVLLKFKSKIRVVSCGYYHTAFVTVDGRLFTFGDNDHGKLGLEADQCHSTVEPQHVKTVTNAVVCVSCGANHTAVINDCGALLTFGSGKYGQLGHGPFYDDVVLPKQVTLRRGEFFTFVTCGADHTAVLTKNGKLFTFGDGRHGKLAMGDDCFSNLFEPARVSRLKDFYVEQVSCGGCHMLAVAVRNKGDNVGDDEDISITQEDNYGEDVPDGPRLSHTIPAHGMSARDKRRMKELEQHDTTNIKSSLPPLHRSLPPLAATIGIASKKNQDLLDNNNEKTITSLDKSTLPVITNKRDHDDITKQHRPLPRPRRPPRKNGTESDDEVKHDKPIASELSPRPKPTPRKRKTVKKDKRNEEMTRNNDFRKGDDNEEESVDESDDSQRINGDRNDAQRISGDRNDDDDDRSGGDELAKNGLKIVKAKDDASGVYEDGNMVTEIGKGLLGITEDETGINNDRKEGNESDYDESEEDESKDGSGEQDDDEQETRPVKSKDEVSYEVKEKIVEKNGNNKKLDKQNGAVDEENEQNSKKINKEKDPEKEDMTKQENIAEASKKDEDNKENINKDDSNNNEGDMKKVTEGKNQKVNTKTKKSGVCSVL